MNCDLCGAPVENGKCTRCGKVFNQTPAPDQTPGQPAPGNRHFTTCKVCGAQFAKSAKVCPQCGAKNKKPIFKKWWFWLLIVLLVFILASGGGSDDPSSVSAQSAVSTQAGAEEASQSSAGQAKPASSEPAIEETVLLDESGVRITATNLRSSGLLGPELELLLENNSGQNLIVQARGVSINGYMVDTVMSVDIADGKKANDSLTFLSSSLRNAGITTIADIEFSLHIILADDWSDVINTAPISLKTSAADTYEYSFDDSGIRIYEGNDIQIVSRGLAVTDSLLGKEIMLYIANDSDRSITVQARDMSINGFMVEPIFSTEVAAGKHAVTAITVLDSDLENNHITEIKDAELSFHIFSTDTWNDIADTDVVALSF